MNSIPFTEQALRPAREWGAFLCQKTSKRVGKGRQLFEVFMYYAFNNIYAT